MSHFSAPEWSKATNIYEVNLRQYSFEGTIRAFAAELHRLKKMGVQTLWFMPLTPISVKNRKGSLGSYYACSDYKGINPEFGNEADFLDFMKQAHDRGFKVIIDWVANHTGWDHVWTRTHPAFYRQDPETGDFKMPAGMEDIIELDFSHEGMRAAMIDAMKFWVNHFDIDGFRCDLAFWVSLAFWKEARKELDAIKPLFWLGEFDEWEKPAYGEAFDASYTWTWMHRSRDYYQHRLGMGGLVHVLQKYEALGPATMRTWFTTNHDENSWNGTEYEKYGEMALALAVFSATWNGIPLIYSGQELPNKKRLLFFDKDCIEWKGENKLEGFYSTLLHLHATHPALRAGDPSVQTRLLQTSAPGEVLAYLRSRDKQQVLVVLNLSARANFSLRIEDREVYGRYRDVFSNDEIELGSFSDLFLEGWGFFVLEKRNR